MMKKTISVLGSTGSVGRQTLDVAERLGLKVSALAANSNTELIEKQAREFSPAVVALFEPDAAKQLESALSDTDIRVLSGIEGVCECASQEQADIVVCAMSGMIGIKPTIAAIKAKKDIAIANKETLVTAGEIVMKLAEENDIRVLPVDSEHNAIFQCLSAGKHSEVKKLILTCSGGPFFGCTRSQVSKMTASDALKHPTWSMGAKITVDCATLMNKGLEVIEAMRLFNVPSDKIDVVIHRESFIHSMVEFTDGSVIAQMAETDMRLPIQYALTYPNRQAGIDRSLDFSKVGTLTFNSPDMSVFGCLRLAYEAAKSGGTAPIVLNAANEAAVDLFLKNKIGFNDIEYIVESQLNKQNVLFGADIDEIIRLDTSIKKDILAVYGG